MTREMFEDLLDRHGPDLARWPEGTRTAAETLMARDAAAREALAGAQALARMLDTVEVPEPGAALYGRILAEIDAQQPAGGNLLGWMRGLWAQGSALAAAAALGLTIGFIEARASTPALTDDPFTAGPAISAPLTGVDRFGGEF
ncbi:hypothetical protein [Futiania mangrovi]|uniref:Uncharacterized protein n=1 Tax=Futiania mangrovi TaxID=2959716 RepID=A0A9J6PA52_9PROT|nr:hypothetical protein [Futiania mangrovii]MCP1335885.1 hypothetical protein [Futiania mangrovii]